MNNTVTIRLDDETAEKLDALSKGRYKGRGTRSQIFRWLIHDMWEGMKDGKESNQKETM